ncbi:ASCH domain-containing protein [Candidatus Pacearchaeota archaeon]|nr:ASCH domain-containing protein [Candidatus Pacearchaeota archaeon]
MNAFSRALIIDEPHISKILSGEKTWEMRSTPIYIRGRIGLIKKGSGEIVGSAELFECGEALNEQTALLSFEYHKVADLEKIKKWKYPWKLRNIIRFKKPITYKHPQGAVIWVKV